MKVVSNLLIAQLFLNLALTGLVTATAQEKTTAQIRLKSNATQKVDTTSLSAKKASAKQDGAKQANAKQDGEKPSSDTGPDTKTATIKISDADSPTNEPGIKKPGSSQSVKSAPSNRTSVSLTIAKLRQRCRNIKPRIESSLKHYFLQKENSEERSPWGIMHAMVAFGPYAEMYADGRLMKDVDWLCQNGRCRSWRLLRLEDGKLATNNGPGRQGHDGQFLAILAQSQIPKTKALIVEGKKFTIEDLIQYEKDTCKAGTELTFKLIGLSHYIDSDETWKSSDGQVWNLEKIVNEELKQPINGVACGGTHRLMGYSYSLLMRKLQNKPITGAWKRADEFVTDFRKYALSMQNRDGSFSTDWFKSRQARRDPQRRVQTTGHILEWLIFSATEKELADPRIVRSVDYLSKLMWNDRRTKWEVGPKGHAVRALRLFYERALATPAGPASKNVADQSAKIRNSRPFYSR